MTAVRVYVWLSEAGNFHTNQEAADADTIAAAFENALTFELARRIATVSREPTKGPIMISITLTMEELAQIVTLLRAHAASDQERSKLLKRMTPRDCLGYSPNKEMAKAFGEQSDATLALANRIEAVGKLPLSQPIKPS